MTEDSWKDTKQRILDTFEVVDQYTEDLDPGSADTVEFSTEQGLLRASFITKPKVIDKKTLYSNRIGGDVRVEYDYSEDETVCHLEIDRWDEINESWVSLQGSLF